MPTILKRIFVIIGILLIVFVVLVVSGPIIIAIIDSTKLDIVSWWYSGSDEQGRVALELSYKTAHPGIEIYDSTMGSMIPEAVLNAELEAGNPPDSFQTGIGYELIHSWVATGYLEPVTFIFEQNNWLDKYPPGMLDLLTHDGQIWGVPIEVCRRNILWYNLAVLAQYDLAPPENWEHFFNAAGTLKAAGVTPLVTDYRETLFEAVLLSSLGPEKYRGFLNSDIDWSDPLVTEALNTLSQIYAYGDDIVLGTENAILSVVNGKAAMAITSEWATSYLPLKAKIGSAPTPGAQNTFIVSASAFVLPKKAHHRDLAIDWLTLCGSREGQDAFSAASANLPARIDANPVLYNDYYQSALPGWSSSQVVPSLWISQNSRQTDRIVDVIKYFAAHPDIETAQQGLIQASKGEEIPEIVLHKAIREEYLLGLGGSTFTQPLQQALACNLMGISCTWLPQVSESLERKFGADPEASVSKAAAKRISNIQHSGTHEAYINLIEGKTDFILVAREPSADELALAQEKGIQFDVQAAALDAFVFLVNIENPIDNLTVEQIVDIYTGKITSWEELGIHIDPQSISSEPIHAYQRERNSDGQELMEKLVMQGTPIIEAPDMILSSMSWPFHSIGGSVSKGDGDKLGIGYSNYYYTTYIFPHNYIKLVSINGIAPTTENITARAYPLISEIYAVVQKGLPADEPALLFRDWLLTEEGQQAVKESGYAPLR